MPSRLPSLNALRTFEAAARHASFTLAAAELSVTPAAVGFQIKQLEEEVGAPLFIRNHRAVVLTDAGARFAHDLAPAFETISTAWQNLDKPERGSRLKVTAPDNATLDWLIPVTDAAKAQGPSPQISWDASRTVRDLESGDWDVALRTVAPTDDGYFGEPILHRWLTPMMRPELARHVQRPRDVLKHDLIKTETEYQDGWRAYFDLLTPRPDPEFKLTCPGTRIALELAVKFNSVALGGFFFAESYLDAGSLVSPIPMAISYKSPIWLICKKGRETSEEILWLRSVLHESAAKMNARLDGVEMFDVSGNPVAAFQ